MTEHEYRELPEYVALDAALDHLARIRADLDEKQAILDAHKAELIPYEIAVKKAKEAERAAYEAAAAAALAVKDAYGDMNPIPQEVSIAIVNKAQYDEGVLTKWALDNGMYELLKIELKSSKVLEALKNGTLTGEQAQIEVVFQPRIATKLGHRLLAKRDKD